MVMATYEVHRIMLTTEERDVLAQAQKIIKKFQSYIEEDLEDLPDDYVSVQGLEKHSYSYEDIAPTIDTLTVLADSNYIMIE